MAATLFLAVVLRARWEEHRVEARVVAKQAAAPGVGWLLVLAFAQLRVTTKDAWERRGRAGCSSNSAASVRLERRDLRAALVGDEAWQRSACAHQRGRCGDAEERVQRMRSKAAAASERARRAGLAQAAKARLQHWGVCGPLPRDCTGIAALGTPAVTTAKRTHSPSSAS
jgi:hypothetical protein